MPISQTSTELSSDFSLLPFEDLLHEALPAFKREMKGRAYGHEALRSAWHWFKAGFEGAVSGK